uniref:Uncharacterized protein n=1 Tax=Timema douglasi TaxID=61478 RepID=A0A7R8VKZ3_TIMDO|nr:unnamed protein product [Timema douglasi]
MKRIFTILLAAWLAGTAQAESLDWFQTKVTPLTALCQEETGSNKDDILKVVNRHEPDTRESQCLLACVYRRLGGMTHTGMATREELRDSLLELYRDSEYKQSKVEAIIDHCGPQVALQPDVCCMAKKLFDCIKENVY